MESPELVALEGPRKKVRFSSDTLNDLLFWGIHLCVVAVSLAVVWSKLDSTTKALLKIVALQNEEMVLVQQQAISAKKQAEQAEIARAEAADEARQTKVTLKTVLDQQADFRKLATQTVDDMTARFDAIQANVLSALDQIKSLQAQLAGTAKSSQTQAATAQNVAANAQGAAASARARAAGLGGALASKRRQLRRADKKITALKDRNIIQRILNTGPK